MKNKHLVLLFAAALGIGWLTRDLPWRRALRFETGLVRIDTSAVTRLTLFVPANPELSFERTESGWAATQRNRSVAVLPEALTNILGVLTDIQSLSIVKTNRPDTLDLVENKWIRLLIFEGDKAAERLRIGKEIMQNGAPATYIELEEHAGMYLVKGNLRQLFNKSLEDFRLRTVVAYDPMAVHAVELAWPDSSFYHFEKNDSSGLWRMDGDSLLGIPDDSVRQWLGLFRQLNDCPFADHFDESRANETRLLRVTLFQGAQGIQLDFFHLLRPDVPEEPSKDTGPSRLLATNFVYSSQNPLNYFALPDTLLIRRIHAGPLRPDTVQVNASQGTPHENRSPGSR